MLQDRKLTDIILGIESDVKMLIKLYNNVDTTLKVILNNINNSKKSQAPQPQLQQPQPPQRPLQAPVKVNYPPQESIEEIRNRKIPAPKIDSEGMELIAKLSMEKARQQKLPLQSKTQITQTINYPDGRKLFLANIKIFKDGTLINQTRTSPKGKWTAPLNPGEYFIHVSKVDSETKRLVELKYNISVPEASAPVELEAAIVR